MSLEQKILKYLPLAEGVARRYNDDDIMGVARLALVEAVSRNNLDESKLRAYIITFINGRIKDYLSKRPTVPIPRSLIRKEQERAYDCCEEPDYESLRPKYVSLDTVECHLATKFDYEDLFRQYGLSKVEIDIIKMRIQGYKHNEICDKYKKSHGWCNYILNELRKRIRAYERAR